VINYAEEHNFKLTTVSETLGLWKTKFLC
jgi:hypothetical protein